MKTKKYKFQFVEFMPEDIQDGIIYISMEYAVAVHKCACGCGQKVVTPFTPTDWKVTFDGESISLSPSIGNWSFPCRSHYFIRNNNVAWAKNMSDEAIEFGRQRDRKNKSIFYGQTDSHEKMSTDVSVDTTSSQKREGLFSAIIRFLGFK
jgi:hypothetical protein